MKKVENLTIFELEAKVNEFKKEGYQETVAIESVELGKLSGLPVVLTTNNVFSASFSVIPFERKDKDNNVIKLYFTACKFNLKHLTTGRKYSDVNVKVTEELKNIYSNPANLTKEALMESVEYIDSSNRKRSIVKLISVDR